MSAKPIKATIRFCLLGGLALIVLYILALAFKPDSQVRSIRLPSGRVIRLEEYTFKKGAVWHTLHMNSTARKIFRFLPRSVTKRIRWLQPDIQSVSRNTFSREPFLTLQFGWQNPQKYEAGPGTRVIVSDDRGQTFDGVVNDMGSYGVYDLDAFPRRGKELRLKLMDGDSPLGEFQIANPNPGPHPIWKADSIPITATNGTLEITLMRFIADATFVPGKTWPTTSCMFRVREDGKESLAWAPAEFEVSDATGNHWKAPFHASAERAEPGCVTGSFLGALWADEAAWKLRVAFKLAGDKSTNPKTRAVEYSVKPQFACADNKQAEQRHK